MEFLNTIEQKLDQQDANDPGLLSKRKDKAEVFPFRERYLEFVVSTGEMTDRYQTMLAELYISNLFKIQDRDIKDDILMPELINPKRQKLIAFLEEKNNYNPSVLLEKVRDSWMIEEEIILLVKEKKYEPAIEIFVKNGQYQEAEDFCN